MAIQDAISVLKNKVLGNPYYVEDFEELIQSLFDNCKTELTAQLDQVRDTYKEQQVNVIDLRFEREITILPSGAASVAIIGILIYRIE